MSDNAAIITQNLAKTFPGNVAAIHDLDLRVATGSVYGLIGRNGAGKTTAMRLIMGLLRRDHGEATVLGRDLWTADRAHRARCAYVSQEQRLPSIRTIDDLCRSCVYFYERWDPDYARNLAKRWGLTWDRQLGVMSGGERRKVAILLALACRPEVLLLDEPAIGLDPIARRELIDELVEALGRGDGCTVLFSTHIITDLERIAESIGIMDRGCLLTAGRLDEFQSRTRRVQVIFPGGTVPDGFTIPGTLRSQIAGPVWTAVVRLASEAVLDQVRSIPGVRVQEFPLGLEEIVIETLGPSAHAELMDATIQEATS
jgi:ABC-2 type transport system ATP-binding protein